MPNPPDIPEVHNTVICIIVTYKPDFIELTSTLEVLREQVAKVVVVDNFSGNFARQKLNHLLGDDGYNYCELIPLDKNHGLAYAQNVGINYALDHDCEFALLLDQDSNPEPGFVKHLLQVFFEAKSTNIAVVGPVIDDRRVSRDLAGCDGDKVSAVKRDFIIASGSLIKRTALLDVGVMIEELFIDHIDHEWCFRAKSLGYEIYQSAHAKLSHALGDKVVSMWLFGWKHVSIHSPLRNYYKVRNAIYLCSLKYIPFKWRLFFLLQSIKVSVFSILVAGERSKRLHYLYASLRDGITSRLGGFDGFDE